MLKPNLINNAKLENSFVYATIHRQSNVDDKQKLRKIVEAFNEINKKVPIILPLHPRTEKRLKENDISFNFQTYKPVPYKESLWLLMNCDTVVTDSGGLIREAYFARKNTLLILENPVWPEIEEAGCSLSTKNVNLNDILEGFSSCLQLNGDFSTQIFGDGSASENILKSILQHNKGAS